MWCPKPGGVCHSQRGDGRNRVNLLCRQPSAAHGSRLGAGQHTVARRLDIVVIAVVLAGVLYTVLRRQAMKRSAGNKGYTHEPIVSFQENPLAEPAGECLGHLNPADGWASGAGTTALREDPHRASPPEGKGRLTAAAAWKRLLQIEPRNPALAGLAQFERQSTPYARAITDELKKNLKPTAMPSGASKATAQKRSIPSY